MDLEVPGNRILELDDYSSDLEDIDGIGVDARLHFCYVYTLLSQNISHFKRPTFHNTFPKSDGTFQGFYHQSSIGAH